MTNMKRLKTKVLAYKNVVQNCFQIWPSLVLHFKILGHTYFLSQNLLGPRIINPFQKNVGDLGPQNWVLLWWC